MADDTARGSRTRRMVVVALAAWLSVVVLATALAWFAIGRAGSEVLDPSAQQVPTPSASASGSAGTTPPTSDPATTAPPASPPETSAPPTSAPASSRPPASREQVVTVPGGQAQFRCTGDVLTVPFATPATGWSVRKESSNGGAMIRVEFQAGEDGFEIEAVCASGRPSVEIDYRRH